MTLEEKIEQLQKTCMEDARMQANNMVAQYETTLTQLYQEHEAATKAQAEGRIKAECDHARQELNKAMSKSRLDLKHKLSQYQMDLKSKIFEEAASLLQQYMKTDEYTSLLLSHIREAMDFAKGQPVTIYLNPSDKEKQDFLEGQTGASLTISNEDFLGGLRAVIRERNVLIDHSFLSAFGEAKSTFQFAGNQRNSIQGGIML